MEATEPGRLLSGRYRLIAEIGRGGMGVVWRGHDELLKRDVAVKEILWPPHLTEQERQLACRRAIREAQMAGRLNHQNVVRIYDIVEEDDHPSIVMELLPYRSLHDILREDGPLRPGEAAQVGLSVLAALRAAHEEGILHRDVKPANILVGTDGRVVLTDFGIARAADSPTLTIGGALLGSPSYIAPERAMGEPAGAASTPADLWGLGASLYAAVEGHPPFQRNSALATLTAVVADEPEEAAHAGPLGPVISGLLRKDPDERLGPDETERMLRRAANPSEPAAAIPPSRAPVLAIPPPAEAPGEASPPAEAGPAEAPAPPAETPALETAATDARPAEDLLPTDARPAEDLLTAGNLRRAQEPPAQTPEPVASDSPGDPAPPAEPEPLASRAGRRPRGLLVAVAALVVAAAAVTALAFVLTSSPGHPAAPSAASTHPAASGSASAKASPAVTPSTPATPSATSPSSAAAVKTAQPRTSPSSPAAATGSGAGTAYGTLPAGYHRFTNSTGFSIGVPEGWLISHVGHYVYLRDPADGNIFLLIDQSDTPNPDPLANWEQQETARESTYPDYRRIRLASVSYPQAEKAADWEFTYTRNGLPVHILNRNVLANASHAYALYWSAPDSDWDAYFHYFQAFAATFRPAA